MSSPLPWLKILAPRTIVTTTRAISRTAFRSVVLTLAVVIGAASVTGCTPRLVPPVPEQHAEVETVSEWSHRRAEPYGIPERQLRAYAYAAWRVESDGGCAVGWPTIAAIAQIASDHGRADGSTVGEDGVTTVPLRGLHVLDLPPVIVPDTDAGATDGDPINDVAVGPMQIMPSRWEQFSEAAEPGTRPNPDNVDDAALTAARIICAAGNPTTPEGWDEGVKRFFYSPEHIKAVHAVASELSR